ncbi:hypothetical protein [Azonexus sp. IMCC34839]|uniref:hypothetical protein n=1 Tax=Azonexus sp. IMCC34839 TaxID=3133695 RepID=UPI00399BC54B
MALSALGEFIGTVVLDALSQTLFYFTGKMLVPVVSLGHWQAGDLAEEVEKPRPSWRSAIVRNDEGKRLISPDGQVLLGLVFWIVVALAIVLPHI